MFCEPLRRGWLQSAVGAGFAVCAATAFILGTSFNSRVQAQSPSACGTDMRILVIAADAREVDLPAITQTLDYLGTPYSVYAAANTPGGLTPALLGSGCRAYYQAVIQTTGDL